MNERTINWFAHTIKEIAMYAESFSDESAKQKMLESIKCLATVVEDKTKV